MKITGSDIKAIRNNLKLSQTAFAKEIGVSMRSVQDYESGKTMPAGDKLMRILELNKQNTVYHIPETKEASMSVEDQIAKNILDKLLPSMEKYSNEIIDAIGNLHIELNLIKNKQARLEEMQKDNNKVQEKTFEYIKKK